MRVVHVPAEPVGPPGRGHELHRPLGAGRAARAEPVEAGLDEVDRGEHLPVDAEAALRLAVVAKERRGRGGRAGAEGSAAASSAASGSTRRRRAWSVARASRAEQRPRAATERRVVGQLQEEPLLVQRPERHVPRGRAAVRSGRPCHGSIADRARASFARASPRPRRAARATAPPAEAAPRAPGARTSVCTRPSLGSLGHEPSGSARRAGVRRPRLRASRADARDRRCGPATRPTARSRRRRSTRGRRSGSRPSRTPSAG